MKISAQLLNYLVRECTAEVFDQITEEHKLKVKFKKEKAVQVPVKTKAPVKFGKDVKFEPAVKQVKEAEDQNVAVAPPEAGQGTGDAPPISKEPEPTEPEQPEEPETPTPAPAAKGPMLINPRDKSKLQPVKFAGRDEASIERTLHQLATSVAGPRIKISLGAKRLAREVAANPGASIYFYVGKIDPESEEVFLMADKSLQIAKDDSVQPSELQGVPMASPTQSDAERIPTDDPFYFQNMTGKVRPKPRYGLEESTVKLIKQAVNKLLDGK